MGGWAKVNESEKERSEYCDARKQERSGEQEKLRAMTLVRLPPRITEFMFWNTVPPRLGLAQFLISLKMLAEHPAVNRLIFLPSLRLRSFVRTLQSRTRLLDQIWDLFRNT